MTNTTFRSRCLQLAAAALLAAALLAPAAARAAEVAPPPVPDTPAGDLLRWTLGQCAEPDRDTIDERVGDTMNGATAPPPQRLFSEFVRLERISGGGFDIVRLNEIDQFELDVLLRAKDGRSWWMLTLSTATQPPHVEIGDFDFTSLVSAPDSDGMKDWGDVSWRLGVFPLPPKFTIHAEQKRRENRGNRPLLSLRDGERAAVGPAAALFAIVPIAERAAEDPAVLEETVELVPGRRSVVSPALGQAADGEPVALKDLLRAACEGDLTALDHLIGYLGRETVERTAARFQPSDSAETPNTPFLTTAEYFKLKLLPEDDEAYRAFADAETADARREALAALAEKPLPTIEEAEAITTPTRVREVEWRASASELTNALRAIESAMDADETGALREALNKIGPRNRQIGVWTFVCSVSGGEPGVYAEAYLLERIDGERFRFVIAGENPDEEINYRFLSKLPGQVITLMAIEP